MELSCPLGTARRVPQEKFPFSHKINLLIKLCSVKVAGYWPRSFFVVVLHVYGPRRLGS